MSPILICTQIPILTCQTCYNYQAQEDYCAWSHTPDSATGRCQHWEPDSRLNFREEPYPCQGGDPDALWGFADCHGCPHYPA